MFDHIKKYLLSQLDKTTAWFGLIGLALLALHLHTFMLILFVLMICMKESNFSELFKKWTGEVRKIAEEE